MIQNRRRSRHQNGSTKSNKTFDKHNGIKRIKDDELDFDPRKFDLTALIEEEEQADPAFSLLSALRDDSDG